MKNMAINFGEHILELAFVAGTPPGYPFLFGDERAIYIPDFYMATTPVTQALWTRVMGDNRPASSPFPYARFIEKSLGLEAVIAHARACPGRADA